MTGPPEAITPVGEVEFAHLMVPFREKVGDRVAIGVSGGADSLSLLFLLDRWCRGVGCELWALTVDHGWRSEAQEEIAHVGRVARRLEVPHVVLRWRGDHLSQDCSQGGSQAAARHVRYELMRGWCRRTGVSALALAHHLEDQAETFLLRLARGSGVDGLAAMSREGHWGDLVLLRPLLGVSRVRLRATLEEVGVVWREDRSNQERRFARVRMRQLLGVVQEEGLTPRRLAVTARRMARVRAALEQMVVDFIRDRVHVESWGACGVVLDALGAVPEEVGLRVLQRMLFSVSGRERPMRLGRLETFYGSVLRGSMGTFAGCRVLLRRGRLWVVREPSMSLQAPSLWLRPGEQGIWDNRFQACWRGENVEQGPVEIRALGEISQEISQEISPGVSAGDGAIPSWGRGSLPSVWREGALIGVPHVARVPFLGLRHVGWLFTESSLYVSNRG